MENAWWKRVLNTHRVAKNVAWLNFYAYWQLRTLGALPSPAPKMYAPSERIPPPHQSKKRWANMLIENYFNFDKNRINTRVASAQFHVQALYWSRWCNCHYYLLMQHLSRLKEVLYYIWEIAQVYEAWCCEKIICYIYFIYLLIC